MLPEVSEEHIPDGVIEHWLYEHGGDDPARHAAHGYGILYREFLHDGERWGINKADLARWAGTAWSYSGDEYLSRAEWRELFHLAGYREDDEPADRPTGSLLLWRGATPEGRARWSWTDARDTAIQFASGWLVQKEIGLVWRAIVEPERLLAKVSLGRGSEYIVDTDALAIEPDGLWCRCPVDLGMFRGDDHQSRMALDLHELVLCPRQ